MQGFPTKRSMYRNLESNEHARIEVSDVRSSLELVNVVIISNINPTFFAVFLF